MKKIFCFINSGRNTEFQNVVALCEDGHCLAGHLSSSEGWAKHDIGINSDWKHENYKKHCPEGYELVWRQIRHGDELAANLETSILLFLKGEEWWQDKSK